MTINHKHPAYTDESQPPHNSAGRMVRNIETPPPHPVEDSQNEPDYEAIMERRAERHRPDWA